MKNLFYSVAMLALVGMTFFSCSDKDVEARIARLEGRIAELEAKNGGRTPSPITSTAAATSSVVSDVPSGPAPAFQFAEEEHDFGSITEGDIVEHTFAFKNTGEAPLIISSATASCGCTVPSWPREPIPVGGDGEITVKFNSRNKPGVQNKTVTITANTNPKISRLRIKSTVTPQGGASGPVK